MVARTPPKQRRSMVAPLNPTLIRETVNKVDKCMARLQELQYRVTGGTKVIAGASLSPRSTRGYLRTSLRRKQETSRIKNGTPRKSPAGKFPATIGGEWQQMSLPAMLLGETMEEILKASQFAKEIVTAVAYKTKKIAPEDPKTPVTEQRKQRPLLENTELKTRRNKEKQNKLTLIRSESDTPSLQRARSRINFKVSPPKKTDFNRVNSNHYVANIVSPKRRPWAKKTVLFPNPLFLSTPPAPQQPKFCKTRSPVIARTTQQIPHKFLIKSPPASKCHVKIKSPQVVSLSPTSSANLSKKSSPKVSTASKLRRSFSPSRIANRLVSPLKSRKNAQKIDGLISALKYRPASIPPKEFPTRRI